MTAVTVSRGGLARLVGRLSLAVCCAVAVAASPAVAAAPRATVDDAGVMARAQPVASGERIELYADGMDVDPAFLGLAESAFRRLAAMPGIHWDAATMGPKIRIYVSKAIRVSHVWNGYRNREDPKAILYLNRRAYRGGVAGTNATYVHEMVHLFTWRYHSHTLREGLADYLALQVLPEATGVGANPKGYDWSKAIPQEIKDRLGTSALPPKSVGTEQSMRAAYYFASYRLVAYLVEAKGLPTFMELYGSRTPAATIKTLYGLTRKEAVRAAGM